MNALLRTRAKVLTAGRLSNIVDVQILLTSEWVVDRCNSAILAPRRRTSRGCSMHIGSKLHPARIGFLPQDDVLPREEVSVPVDGSGRLQNDRVVVAEDPHAFPVPTADARGSFLFRSN